MDRPKPEILLDRAAAFEEEAARLRAEAGSPGTPARGDSERAVRMALAESEQRYRALFEAVDDGFCIIEFIDGPDGPMSDYVHVEANSGYQRHTGIPDIVGKRLREIAPGEEEGWLDLYGGVLRSGVPDRKSVV